MTFNRRKALSALATVPLFSGCAVTYARFRETPGPDWGYLVASTAIELPSALRITSCAFGGTMVGTKDNFMLSTNIAMASTQKLDISTPEISAVIGVQPLPPGRYLLNHIGYYANELQSWRIFDGVAPTFLEMPSRTVLYLGSYKATRANSIAVTDEQQRDLRIALSKSPNLAILPMQNQVPGQRPRSVASNSPASSLRSA